MYEKRFTTFVSLTLLRSFHDNEASSWKVPLLIRHFQMFQTYSGPHVVIYADNRNTASSPFKSYERRISHHCAVPSTAESPPMLQERATYLWKNAQTDRWTKTHTHTLGPTCTIRAWRAPGSCMSLTFNYPPNLTVVSLDRGEEREKERGWKRKKDTVCKERHMPSGEEGDRSFNLYDRVYT